MAYEIIGFEPVDFLRLNYTEEQIGKAARPMINKQLLHHRIDPTLSDKEFGTVVCEIVPNFRAIVPQLIESLAPLSLPGLEKEDDAPFWEVLPAAAVPAFEANVERLNDMTLGEVRIEWKRTLNACGQLNAMYLNGQTHDPQERKDKQNLVRAIGFYFYDRFERENGDGEGGAGQRGPRQ